MMTQDPAYPLFTIFAFLGFVASLVPLSWHLQAWNSGTCYFMVWTSLTCLNHFVNSIAWAGNVVNHSPAWCEISIRIILGSSVGIPASSLCIVRRLHSIAKVQQVAVTRAEKRKAVIVDTLICVLFPIIYVALQYVVQGHRFDLWGDIGCYPALVNTVPTYFISFVPPLIVGLISFVYCALSLYEFNKRRIQFSSFLTSGTSLTMSRYIRLMALAFTEMCLTIPLSIFTIYLNASSTPVGPYQNWDEVHFNYERIGLIPRVLWQRNRLLVVSVELTRWLAPFSALVFFAYFGFAEEARRNYRNFFGRILHLVGLGRPASPTSPSPSKSSFKRFMSKANTTSTLPLHSVSTSSISTNSIHKPHYDLADDPSTFVLDIKPEPKQCNDSENILSPTSTERTVQSDITFSTDASSWRYTI